MRLELRQRVARPFGRDDLLGLVSLRVLVAVPLQARHRQPQQRRPARTHMRHRRLDQPRRLDRIGPVTVEDRQSRKARQIGRDVLPGGLVRRRHGNSVPIVLDIHQQRQLLRRRDRQRRPEASGRAACVAAQHDGDGIAGPFCQDLMPVPCRLSPTDSRRILGSDPTAHRQGMATARVGIVEHHADITAIGITAGPPHARAERIGQRHAQRQQQRPRPIIAARCISVAQLQAQQHLRHVVPARAELVEHLLCRNEVLFLDPVHCATGEDEARNVSPVRLAGKLRVGLSHPWRPSPLHRSDRSPHPRSPQR